MMKIQRSLIKALVFILTLTVTGAFAQPSNIQAGFRFGNTTGFTGKFITKNDFAYEAILGFRSGGAQLYLLFEVRQPVFYKKLENIYFYYGGGVHGGYVRWNDNPRTVGPVHYPDYHDGDYYGNSGPAFGIDGVIGLEMAFHSIPITLAADFKPFAEMYGPYYFRMNFWDFGFHVRYNF